MKLNKLCNSISITVDKNKQNLIFLNTSDVLNGKILHCNYSIREDLPGQAKKSIKNDDILYSEIRPRNCRFAYVSVQNPNDYIVSTKLMVIRRCNELIIPKYLYLYLTSPKIINHLQELAESRSGTFPQITFDEIKSLEINLPSIEEQQHIIDTIGSIDDLIDTNNKIIESLSAYCDKLFKKIDYIDFKSYELGELFDIKIGRTPPRAEKEWFNCEPSIKWISISDMCDKFKFIFKTKECLTIRAVSKFNVPIIPKDTLIMSFKLTVGRLGITTEDMLSNEAIAAFNTDNLVLRNYVLFYLSNFDFKSLGNTSSIANAINSKIIKTISIKVPSEIELTYFNDKASLLLDKILNISKQNNTLIKLKEMYLKKFFG